ncbi:methyl-accepting chemotaxis protein [Pseudoalteromonas xiamenensis]|uniref:Methyl-accepting chemotaxis protein n=1 Tax=Pseudoalteromonas xiamenensis TaxID=882626 RepID=A0A975DIJ9_9GAMM|nr:methyl-accepting chemotaxis protein [Pseudoalteromonas xiamenensis]QTH72377.1 methyl-accepting chemotaxis protein [Pseudoalteromonas xiamenensis]
MDVLNRFSIFQRLALLVIVVLMGLVLLSITSLNQQYQALEKLQYEKTQHVVENAHSLVTHFHNLYVSGKLTEEDAKQAALSAVAELRYEDNNYFWINDFQPKMVMHPMKPALNGQSLANNQDPDGKKLFVEMVNIVTKQGAGFIPYKWPKPGKDKPVDKISYVKGFKPWQWIIGSGIYLDTIDASHAELRNFMLFDVGLIILLLIALSVVIGRSIVTPVNRAVSMMKNIAEGEGDLTQRLELKGSDEIAELATYFNSYTEKMRRSMQSVSHNAIEVERLAIQVDGASHKNLRFIEEQSDSSRQIATAVEEMSHQIREVSDNASAADTVAREAQNNATAGKSVINTTISAINKLSNTIEEVSKVTAELAAQTNSIGSVLDVIRGISEQTNLLALNAAIEAARAGEQGRGFAVVADEVRTLASRTGQSTDEIQVMIEKLQQGARAAVTAVTQSQSISQSTVTQAAQANTVLDEIERLIQVISEMNSHIAQSADEQSTVAQDVNRRISDLSDSTHHSLDTTQALTSASENLKKASHHLTEVVSGFKIS